MNRYSFAANKMHPSGSSTLVDGEQFVSPALIQLKFSILESQGSLLPPQTAFTSVEIECYRFFFFFSFDLVMN